MKNKITFALAGAILLSLMTAVTIFVAIFIGYWLVILSAAIGAYAGLTVMKEEKATDTDIPEDWYKDVGPDVDPETDDYFGKSTKH